MIFLWPKQWTFEFYFSEQYHPTVLWLLPFLGHIHMAVFLLAASKISLMFIYDFTMITC